MDKKEAPKKDEPKVDSEKVYVFKGNGKHDGKPFQKGQVAKASHGQLKTWLANGVIVEKK